MVGSAPRKRLRWWTCGVPPILPKRASLSFLPFILTPDDVEKWRKDFPAAPDGRALRPWPPSEPERRGGAARSRSGCGLPRGRHCRLDRAGFPDAPRHRPDARQVGDARAPEDRPHRLSLADPPLHRSAGGVHLRARPSRFSAVAKETGANAVRRRRRRIHARGRALLASTRSCASTASHDPALDHLPTIVRGADTSRHDLAPQCGGLFAISLGLSANFPDDHEMLEHGMVMYDALYTWCRSAASRDAQLAGREPRKRPGVAEVSVAAGDRSRPRTACRCARRSGSGCASRA